MKTLRKAGFLAVLLFVFAWCGFAQSSTITGAITTYAVDRGGISMATSGTSPATVVGYASIQPGAGSTTPAGLAIFGFRQNDVLVSEAGVPASPLIQSGRIYAEVNGPVKTGVAIANPNSQPATVSFFFTDGNGNFGSGTTIVPANGQIAKFLNELPFNAPSSLSGTFTFSSSIPVSVVALRGLINENGEFLITTLPVADLSASPAVGVLVFPHFADGGGWTTQIVLVNHGNSVLSGTVQFLNRSGQAATVAVNSVANTSFAYSIPARSSQKLQTSGATTATLSGSVRVVPAGATVAPSGLAIFSFRNEDITVAEAGVPAVPAGNAFRLYAEAAGVFPTPGSIQPGLAVANMSASPATVSLELTRLDGTSTGLTGTLELGANGQIATFLNQITGFESLPTPVQGVLRISSNASIAVVGLRGRYNERNDFLITTTPPINETSAPSSTPIYFPHIVDSGGYTTQFILISRHVGQSSASTMQLFSQSGEALNLTFRNVTPVQVASVTVGLAINSLTVGQTTTPAATARDASNNVLNGRTANWVTSNPSIATVSPLGQVTAVAPGIVTITVTIEGRAGSAVLYVTPAPTSSVVLAIDPAILPGIDQKLTQFIADLSLEGYRVVIHSITERIPSDLRQTIKNYYDRLSPRLEGVIFMGSTPIPTATYAYPGGAIYRGLSMQYYMDLDGTFSFKGGQVTNEIDSHTGNVEIEIWTSVLPAYGNQASTVAYINDYLTKNHNYRSGKVIVHRGFIQPVIGSRITTEALYNYQFQIIRDEYFVRLNQRGNFFVGIDNKLGDLSRFPTSQVSYEREMLTDKYDVASIGAHGNIVSFGSFNEWGSIVVDIAFARSKPLKPIFLLEHSCNTAAINAYPNLASEFLYNKNNNVLVFAGATAEQGGMGDTARGTATNYEAELFTSGQSIGTAHFAPMRLPYVGAFAAFRDAYAAQQILLGDGTLRLQEFMRR